MKLRLKSSLTGTDLFLFGIIQFLGAPQPSDSANILIYSIFSSYSHRIAIWPLVDSLVSHGHNITFISPYDPRSGTINPAVTEFRPRDFGDWYDEFEREDSDNIFEYRAHRADVSEPTAFTQFALLICEKFLSSGQVLDWLQNPDNQYDLIIVDVLMNECAYPFAVKFQAPIILYSTSSIAPWLYEPFGLHVESSWSPDIYLNVRGGVDMDFWSKIRSTIEPLYWQYEREWIYFPQMEELIHEKIPWLLEGMPSLSEIEQQYVKLIFVNIHYSEEYGRALPPFVVPVGGAQECFEEQQHVAVASLPKELEAFINQPDSATGDGFIYVSFGSYADVFSNQTFQSVFLETFKSMSHIRFIVKSKIEPPVNLPPNILMTKWVPQKQLLAHSKIRGFITHAGLLSTHEAICHAVPLIACPIFGEQDYNAERIARDEYGIRLEILSITKSQLLNAILEILNNSKYSKNIRKISQIFKDRPESPIQTATWWTEYVLRHFNNSSSNLHNDTKNYLKPLTGHQNWAQKRLLDVWGFIFGVLFVTFYILYVILKLLIKIGYYKIFVAKNTSTTSNSSKGKSSRKSKVL